MRCWIIGLFLALNASAYPSNGSSGEVELQYSRDVLTNEEAENTLQRRGSKKKGKNEAEKSGASARPATSSTLSSNRIEPILPPWRDPSMAIRWQPQSPGSQGKRTGQPLLGPSSPVSPQSPFSSVAYGPGLSSSPGQNTALLPVATPSRPPFASPPRNPGSSGQSSQRRRSDSKRASRSREPEPLTITESALTRLRLSQGSGAIQTSSDVEASPRTPSGRSPQSPQPQPVPKKRPTSPDGSPPPPLRKSPPPSPPLSREPASPPRQPPTPHPLIEQGVPAARGIDWLSHRKVIANDWKAMAQVEREIQASNAHTIGKAENARDIARSARHLDRQHIREARTALTNGKALDRDVMAAVQKSKDSTRRAQAMTFGLWNAHSQAAEALSDNNNYIDGVKHFQKAHRALARQEVILQHGQAFDYKYVNQGVKEGLENMNEKGVPPHVASIQRAVTMRRTYKAAAEGYHQSWRDYQRVRQEFSGSSSDESEKSTFDDILPERRRGGQSQRP